MKPLTIELTERALVEALNLKNATPMYSNLSLRVYLAGKGCDGFEYGVCFDAKGPLDKEFLIGDLEIICDPESWKFIAGSTVDWVDDERGRGFLVSNPNHRKFRGKFYRKTGWETKLPGNELPKS